MCVLTVFTKTDSAPAAILAAGGLTVVAVDRNEHALGDLPDSVRRELADTTDPPVAPRLIDRIAGEVGPRRTYRAGRTEASPGWPAPARGASR